MFTLASLAAFFLGRARSSSSPRQPPSPPPPHQDPATGLLDRRGFRIGLWAALREAERAGRDASLLLIDVDRVRHGGEGALAQVLRVVRLACRGGELLGHHGESTLVMLVPDAHAPEAELLAYRIHDALHRPPHPISVSIGVADVERAGGWLPRALVAAADGALQAAKAAGGSRVFVASPPGMVRRACAIAEEKPWIG